MLFKLTEAKFKEKKQINLLSISGVPNAYGAAYEDQELSGA